MQTGSRCHSCQRNESACNVERSAFVQPTPTGHFRTIAGRSQRGFSFGLASLQGEPWFEAFKLRSLAFSSRLQFVFTASSDSKSAAITPSWRQIYASKQPAFGKSVVTNLSSLPVYSMPHIMLYVSSPVHPSRDQAQASAECPPLQINSIGALGPNSTVSQ